MNDSSPAFGAYFGTPAFLDDAQVSHALTSILSDKTVTCRMSHSFYIKWIFLGAVLGLLPLLVFLAPLPHSNSSFWALPAFSTMPLIPKIVLILVIILGWYLLLWGLLSRRSITFDFYENYVTLSQGFPSYATQNIRLADIQELKVSTEPGFGRQNRPPPIAHVLSLAMLVEDLKLIKTLDETSLRQIIENIATASGGTLLPGNRAETIREKIGDTLSEK